MTTETETPFLNVAALEPLFAPWEKAPDIVKHVHKQMATSIVMEIATKIVRDLQSDLWDHERMALWKAIEEGYCHYCGSSYLPCYCQDD